MAALPSISFRGPGNTVTPPAMRPPPSLTASSHAVLLVHGYNNDEPGAAASYRAFTDLAAIPGAHFVGVQWPGDNWSNFLYYMRSIAQARASGAVLAQVLRQAATARRGLRVDIVAHSMGCRLVLEALALLLTDWPPDLQVGRVVLMAAAVPVFLLESAGPPTLAATFTSGRSRYLSLYSRDDNVLSKAFRIGQTLAPGPEGRFPVALGAREWRATTIAAAMNLLQREARRAGHSDYWGKKDNTLEIAVAAIEVAREFLTTGGLRRVEERRVGERRA